MENKIQQFLDWFLIFTPSEQFLPRDDEGEIFTPTSRGRFLERMGLFFYGNQVIISFSVISENDIMNCKISNWDKTHFNHPQSKDPWKLARCSIRRVSNHWRPKNYGVLGRSGDRFIVRSSMVTYL